MLLAGSHAGSQHYPGSPGSSLVSSPEAEGHQLHSYTSIDLGLKISKRFIWFGVMLFNELVSNTGFIQASSCKIQGLFKDF